MSKELKAALALFNEKHTFKPGDIVEWKPGLKNKRSPGPFIIGEVLNVPLFETTDGGSGSCYFRQPIDVTAGFIDSDGDFLFYHYDSRRFKPVESPKPMPPAHT